MKFKMMVIKIIHFGTALSNKEIIKTEFLAKAILIIKVKLNLKKAS